MANKELMKPSYMIEPAFNSHVTKFASNSEVY